MSKGGSWGSAANHLRSSEHFVPNAGERAYFRLFARPTPVPAICQLLLCLAVDPEFQEDRLADYQEKFHSLWVPKFGHRMAILLYVWHVLRQVRFIDWIIRLLSSGSP